MNKILFVCTVLLFTSLDSVGQERYYHDCQCKSSFKIYTTDETYADSLNIFQSHLVQLQELNFLHFENENHVISFLKEPVYVELKSQTELFQEYGFNLPEVISSENVSNVIFYLIRNNRAQENSISIVKQIRE